MISTVSNVQTGIRQRSLRKHCRLGRATSLVFVMATGVIVALASGASDANAQATVHWDAGNDSSADLTTGAVGNWDTATTPWNDTAPAAQPGGANLAFTNGDSVVFNDADPVGG